MENPKQILLDHQQSSVTFDDQKYQDRRNLIQKTDEEIIAEGTKEGIASSDSSVSFLTRCIRENNLFFLQFSGCDKMTDIGCSDIGVPVGVDIKNSIKSITKFDLVDPYEEESNVFEGVKDRSSFKFFKTDGLGFLLKQESGSTNVMTASIDVALIPSHGYLMRLAQEIYRVTAQNGFYISVNSEDLEEEALKLFAFVKEFNHIKVFYKKKLEDFANPNEELNAIIADYRLSLDLENASGSQRLRATDILDHYCTMFRGALENEGWGEIYSAIKQYVVKGSYVREDEKIDSIRKTINQFLRKYFSEALKKVERETGKGID
jgi:hypothetical protein